MSRSIPPYSDWLTVLNLILGDPVVSLAGIALALVQAVPSPEVERVRRRDFQNAAGNLRQMGYLVSVCCGNHREEKGWADLIAPTLHPNEIKWALTGTSFSYGEGGKVFPLWERQHRDTLYPLTIPSDSEACIMRSQ